MFFSSRHFWSINVSLLNKSKKVKVKKWKWRDIRPSMVTHTQNLGSAINPLKVHTHSSEHTPWTHTGAVGIHLCCGARGAVGGSVPCSRAPQSWYWGWRECCTFTVCDGVNRGSMQIHLQSFIRRHGQKQAGSKHQQTGMAQARQKSNPRTDEREIQDRQKIRKQTIRQHDVTRLRLELELETRTGNCLRKVAITRRAINAKQYSAIRKSKSMAYKVYLIGCSCVCNQCNGWWEM